MIITFTGQPNSGKTTLSQQLTEYLKLKGHTVNWIDGDNLREMVKNFDYSERGRKRNIETAYSIARLYNRTTNYVVVSLVSPFKDLRESLKSDPSTITKEIYLHSSRFREGKMVSYYEPPTNNCLTIDTDKSNIPESLKLIIDYIS